MSDGTQAAQGSIDVPPAAHERFDQLSGMLRPDGRMQVRPEGFWTSAAARRAVEVAETAGTPVLAHVPDHALAECAVLADAGFAIARREAVIVFEVETALAAIAGLPLQPGVDIRSAADVDEDQLRLLDDELRQDVPGSSGWKSTPEEFREHTFADPAFDPRTYLVAVVGEPGPLIALVRVWMNLSGPRLGLVGVRREYRRRGIASALLACALQAVAATGATTVTAEHDLANRASAMLAARLGARRLDTTLELVYEPGGEASRVA